MKNVPSRFNLSTRLILVIMGIVSVIALPLVFGCEGSYSQYYKNIPVLFTIIFSTLSVGLFIHSNGEWRLPAIFLIILSVCDMYRFPVIHYGAAILFFTLSTYAMWNDKRVSGFGKISLVLYFLFFIDLLIFELVQVLIICIFHLIYVIKMFNIKLEKLIIEEVIEEEK
mgnify:FL=1|tara:strand:+ start:96 stop:602 length:507 start_codon:yes stop_codon:yes gene_type:complete